MLGLMGVPHKEKTLLGRAFAKKRQLTFLGVCTAAPNFADEDDFGARLAAWERVLDSLDALYAKHGLAAPAITDYTPVDLMARVLMCASQRTLSDEDEDRLARFVVRCLEVANQRLSLLIVVPFAQDENMMTLSRVEALNAMTMGLAVDERLRVPRFSLSRLDARRTERITTMEAMMAHALKQAEQDRHGAVVH
jgi:hypothetical protein